MLECLSHDFGPHGHPSLRSLAQRYFQTSEMKKRALSHQAGVVPQAMSVVLWRTMSVWVE